MLRAHDRGPGAREVVEQAGHRRGPGRVQLGRGLVEDEDVGPHRDDARDRDPLLLPARQGERLAVRQMVDPETSKGLVDPRVHRVARHPEILEPEGELLAHGQLRCRQLIGGRREDDPDLAEKSGRRGRRSVAAVHDDATGQLRTDDPRHEPGCRKRQGGLARSGPSGDAQALP